MASLNKVIILGNLGQDPELRYTANQTPVVTLSVATTEHRKGPDGQRQEQTDWHRVIVWSRQAENCHKYLKKGRSVLIEGRITYRSWDDKNGQKRYSTEIVASNIQFMPAAGGSRDSWQPNDGGSRSNQDFGGYMPEGDPFSGGSSVPQAGGYGQDSYGSNASAPSFPRADNQSSQSSGNKMPDLDDIPF